MGALRHALAAALAAACVSAAPASATNAPIETVAGAFGGVALPDPGLGATKPANTVALSGPSGMSPVPQANGGGILFANQGSNQILHVDGAGHLRVVAGSGEAGPSVLQGTRPAPPGSAFTDMKGPFGVSFFQSNLNEAPDDLQFFVADTGNGQVDWVEGVAASTFVTGLSSPQDVEFEHGGPDWLVADTESAVVRENGTIIAGNGSATGTPPHAGDSNPKTGSIGRPIDVSFNPLTTAGAPRIYYIASKVTTGGRIFKVYPGEFGDVIAPVADSVSLPAGVGVQALRDGGAVIYSGGGYIYRASPAGALSTIAGNGQVVGSSPDGTRADQMTLNIDGRVTVGDEGLYVAQSPANFIRLIPATAITSGPAKPVAPAHAEFGLTSWDQAASYSCKIDDVAKPRCEEPFERADLSDGSHTFSVVAHTDADALTDPTPATYEWTVDGSAPAVPAIGEPSEDATVPARPTFTWQPASDVGAAGFDRYEVAIDGVKAGAVSDCGAGPCSFASPLLGDGSHKLEVKAVDKVGNTSVSARMFTVASPPTPVLDIAPARTLANRAVAFNASASHDDNGQVVRYEWDLDGNGTFETDTGAQRATTRSYDRTATIPVGLRVTDDSGLTGMTTGTLVVSALAPPGKQLGASINDGDQYTNDPNVTVFSVWPAGMTDLLLSNDGGFKNGRSFGIAEKTPWKLDSSGSERLPKTIYVRFRGGGLTSETFQDDIILDETPPKVLDAQVVAAPAANAAAAKRLTLRVTARDNVSGVGGIQVTGTKRKPGKFLKFRKTLKVRPAKMLYVRVRDRAGNRSRWRVARRR